MCNVWNNTILKEPLQHFKMRLEDFINMQPHHDGFPRLLEELQIAQRDTNHHYARALKDYEEVVKDNPKDKIHMNMLNSADKEEYEQHYKAYRDSLNNIRNARRRFELDRFQRMKEAFKEVLRIIQDPKGVYRNTEIPDKAVSRLPYYFHQSATSNSMTGTVLGKRPLEHSLNARADSKYNVNFHYN